MKKNGIILSVILVFSISGCTSLISSRGAELVADNFVAGLQDSNIKLLMSAYHEDADVTFLDPEKDPLVISGKVQIREMQESTVGSNAIRKINYDTCEKEIIGNKVFYRIVVEVGEMSLLNTLEIEKHGDAWGIIHQTIEASNP
jgi:ketosteroid isomerase-like protein